MTRTLLIYNPNAGRFPPAQAAEKAGEVLRSHGWDVRVERTRDAEHVETLARQAALEDLDVLVVAGGDGSIGRTINGLRGSRTALAVLPMGTANVWARQLQQPRILPSSIQGVIDNANLIAQSTPQPIDIGLCNGLPFLLWAGVGFDAMIVEQAEQKRSHFRKYFVVPEYIARALRTAHTWPGLDCRISGLDRNGSPIRFDGRAQIAVVSNIPLYAGGLATLAPDARLDDGEMELWLFKGQGAVSALSHAWNLLRGTHVKKENVTRLAFSSLDIVADRPATIQTDGDPSPAVSKLRIEVARRALNILVPPTASKDLFTQ